MSLVHVADGAVLRHGYDRWYCDAALLIPDSVRFDGQFTLGVAKNVERQEQFLNHRLVLFRRVDADRSDVSPALLELAVLPGIAHELPIAVRSPVASIENQHL